MKKITNLQTAIEFMESLTEKEKAMLIDVMQKRQIAKIQQELLKNASNSKFNR